MTYKSLAIAKEFVEHKRAMELKLQETMKEDFVAFFKANPYVGSVIWTQYTPYFNDGEPCEFSRHDFSFLPKLDAPPFSEDDEYEFDDPYDMNFFVESKYDSAAYKKLQNDFMEQYGSITFYGTSKAIEEFKAVLNTIPDEVYEAAFGDGKKVIASIDGFETEHYDHD